MSFVAWVVRSDGRRLPVVHRAGGDAWPSEPVPGYPRMTWSKRADAKRACWAFEVPGQRVEIKEEKP